MCAIEDSDIWEAVFQDRWTKKNAGVDSDHYDPPDGEDLDNLVTAHYLLYTSLCTAKLNAIRKQKMLSLQSFLRKGVSLGHVG